jgi:hypothetical protein
VASLREPSSAPLGIIQDMCPDDTDKGREAFAKIEHHLREVCARSRGALVEAMGAALSAINARDALSFFEHAGYRPTGHLL